MENTFAANLRRLRKERGITQEQLAEAVGVSAQAVSKWEMSSFPDAQLLPAIADRLCVTIDALFGRGHEDKSIYQRVLDHLREMPENERMEEIVNICYALPQSFMGVHDYNRIDPHVLAAKHASNYSQYIDEGGMLQMRNNANLHWFLFLPEPENGYDDVLSYDENMVKLFRFLAVPNALRAVYMLMGCDDMTFFRMNTLTEKLGISDRNAQDILDGMSGFGLILETFLNSGKGEEKIYSFRASALFVEFLTFTWLLLHQPGNFNFQADKRGFKRFFKNETYKRDNT